MKKVLLSGILVLLIGLVTKMNAQQCELGYSGWNLINVDSASTTFNGGQSITRFVVDIEFDIKYSDDAKRIYIHTFLAQDYKDFFDCNSSNNPAPTSAVLGTAWDQVGMSIYDLAINNSASRGALGDSITLSLLETYGPDESVELTSTKNSSNIIIKKINKGIPDTDHFVIYNMVVYINNYGPGPLNTRSIVWANDGTINSPQCTLCPPIVPINAPIVEGKNNCQNFSFTIRSTNPDPQSNITCDVYIDYNENGINDGSDLLVKTLTASFSGAEPYSSGSQSYSISTTISKPLVIRLSGNNYGPYYGTTTFDASVPCNPLPVTFKSFTAIRNKQRNEQVKLKWETEKEQNNSGFYVQSRTTGEWKNIGFISTKAENGNSNSVLSYEYNDVNTVKGVTLYRLMQVDLDKKTSYSEVKAVLGKEQGSNVLVYPNPSLDGTVNIVFNNPNSIKEVIVSDITGRVVKHYPQVSNNNLTIEGLNSGFYTIKVTDRSTSVSSVEKVVVK